MHPWYLVRGLLVGIMLAAVFSPACGEACVAKHVMIGGGIGLIIGLLIDIARARSGHELGSKLTGFRWWDILIVLGGVLTFIFISLPKIR